MTLVVGVGRQERLRMSELNALATDPDWQHRFVVGDFESLKYVYTKLAKRVCEGA